MKESTETPNTENSGAVEPGVGCERGLDGQGLPEWYDPEAFRKANRRVIAELDALLEMSHEERDAHNDEMRKLGRCTWDDLIAERYLSGRGDDQPTP